MSGRCQADWEHCVPKVRSAPPRMSLTYRWASRQGLPTEHRRAPVRAVRAKHGERRARATDTS
jgi:hypothetical protein